MRHPFVKNTGTNPEMFVRWCASLCEDFPSCVQFQLKSCLTKDKQACGVADSTQCLLYNKRWAGPPKPTKKMVKDLKALDDKKKMWTCGDGEAVGFQTKGWFAGKGFRCTKAGKLNVPKENKKCKSFQCKNDAKNCCGNDEWVCYTKPNAQLKFQQASV